MSDVADDGSCKTRAHILDFESLRSPKISNDVLSIKAFQIVNGKSLQTG